MRLATVLLSATALVSASAALAADLPTHKEAPPPAPVVAPPYSWTGFHIGIGGGASALQVNSKSRSYLWGYSSGATSGDYHAHGGEKSDLGKFGAFGTIEAGADYQMDRFVVGAFTNFDLQNLSAKSSSVARANCYISTGTCSANANHHAWYKVGDSWDAGLRLGYLVTDRNLLYALGGYSGAQISSGARIDGYGTYNSSSYTTSAASSQSQWKSGFVLGAGWETALTDHITLKTEYRYADYGDVKSDQSFNSFKPPFPSCLPGMDGCGGGARQSGDVAVQTVRVVLGYKF